MKQINTFVLPIIGMFTVSCNPRNELMSSSRSSVVVQEFQFLNGIV